MSSTEKNGLKLESLDVPKKFVSCRRMNKNQFVVKDDSHNSTLNGTIHCFLIALSNYGPSPKI